MNVRCCASGAVVLALALVAVSATGLLLWQRTGELREQVAEAEHTSQMASVLAAQHAKVMEVDMRLSGHLRLAVAPASTAAWCSATTCRPRPTVAPTSCGVMEDG